MNTMAQKKEIMDWISALEDKDVLEKLYQLKSQHEPFDFDAEFAKGLTTEEFRQAMNDRIKNYPQRYAQLQNGSH